MPIYQRNGKTYNIPDSEVEGFEKTYPDATQKYVANGRNYNIPVSERNGFISTYKDATPFDKAPSTTPEVKSVPPVSVVSQGVDSVKDYKPAIQEKPDTDFNLKEVMDGPTDSERKAQERKRIEEQIAQQKLDTGKGLKKAYQDHNRKEKEEDEQKGWFRRIVEGISESGRDARRGSPLSPVQTDENIRNLHAAAESVDNAEELVNESKHKEETGIGAGVAGFGRGFWDKMAKLSTWDMGMLDMSKSTAVLNAAHKFDLNQPLTGEEETLLDAVALEAAANGEFSGDLGRGYKAGSTTAESLPFMAEFMVNPATGTGKAVGKAAAKKIISNFGKEAAKSTIGKIARNSARVAGDIAGAGIMTGTTGVMRTTADAVDRATGDVKPIVDGDGYYRFGGIEEGDGAMGALAKAYGASTIENFSEMFGNYLVPMSNAIGAGAGRVMDKIGLGKVNKIIGDIKSSDVAKVLNDFQSKTQWNGTIGEYLEEQAGMAMNALTVGDNRLSDMVDPDIQIDTFLGVSALGGFFSGIKTAGYAREKYVAKKSLNEISRRASLEFGEEWEPLKGEIDNADDEELASILSDVMSNQELKDLQKQDVLLYAGRLKAYHGANLADLKRKAEGDTPEEVVQAQMNFDVGYKLAEVDRVEKRKAFKVLSGIEGKLDDEFLSAEESVRYDLLKQRADIGKDVANEFAYINAWSKFEGMIHGIRDVIDEKVAISNQYISRVAHQDGNVYDVTLSGDANRHVFPVSGSIVVDENGIVDRKYSDSRFIVRDENGKVEMRSVDDLYKMESMDNAEVLKEVSAQSIREQESARYADEIEMPGEEEKMEAVGALQSGSEVQLNVGGIAREAVVQNVYSDGGIELRFEDRITGHDGKKKHVEVFTAEEVATFLIPSEEVADEAVEVDNGIEDTGEVREVVEGVQEEGEELNVEVTSTESTPVEASEEIVPEKTMASLLLKLPKNKDGAIDYKAMTPRQTFEYTKFSEGDEVAIGDLHADIVDVTEELGKIESKVGKAKGGERIELREQAKVVKSRLSELQTIMGEVVPAPTKEEPIESERMPMDADMLEWTADNSNDADELLSAYNQVKEMASHDSKLKPWEQALLGRKVSTDSFMRFADRNLITGQLAKGWLSKDATSIDQISKEFEMEGLGVSDQEIVDFIIRNPSNYVRKTSDTQNKLGRRFSEVASKVSGMPIGSPESVTGRLFVQNVQQGKTIEGMYQAAQEQALQEDFGREEVFFNAIPDKDAWTDEQVMDSVFDGIEYRDGEYIVSDGMTSDEIDEIYSQLELNNDGRETEEANSQEDEFADAFDEAREIEEPETPGIVAVKNREDTEGDSRIGGLENPNGYLDIDENSVSLQNTSQLEYNGILESVSQGELGTLLEEDSGSEEPSHRLRRRIEEASRDAQKGEGSRGSQQEVNRIIEARAKEDGLWTPIQYLSDFGTPFLSGSENDTYLDRENGIVYKVNNLMNSKELLSLFRRIDLHNEYFPQTRYEFAGVTGFGNGSAVYPIYKQEFIDNAEFTSTNEIDTYMQSLGFKQAGEAAYSNGDVVISDLRPRNVLKDQDGDIYVIDADFKKNHLSTTPVREERENFFDYSKRLDNSQETRKEGIWTPEVANKTLSFAAPDMKPNEDVYGYAERVVNSKKLFDEQSKVNVNPTDAQKDAGNYKMGHVKIGGHEVTIENPKGSVRRGVGANGKAWETPMNNAYGYFRGTKGKDGDHIDTFLGDNLEPESIYVVDQVNEDGSFDEHKVMYGFDSAEDARTAYLSNYEEGWQGLGEITSVPRDVFDEWLKDGTKKWKPFAEYKVVREEVDGKEVADLNDSSVMVEYNQNGTLDEEIADVYAFSKAVKEAKQKAIATGVNKVTYVAIGGKRITENYVPNSTKDIWLKAQNPFVWVKESSVDDASFSGRTNRINADDIRKNELLNDVQINTGAKDIIVNNLNWIQGERTIRESAESGRGNEGGVGISQDGAKFGYGWNERIRDGGIRSEYAGEDSTIQGIESFGERTQKYGESISEYNHRNEREARKSEEVGRGKVNAGVVRKEMQDLVDNLHTPIHVVNELMDEKKERESGVNKDNGIRFRGSVDGIIPPLEKFDLRTNNSQFRIPAAFAEKGERVEKLRNNQPIEITGKEITPSDDLKEYKRNALEYGKSLRGEYKNKDTGIKISLGKNGIKEVLNHDFKDIEQLQSIAAIPQIIENSIYIDTIDNLDVEKNADVSKYHYYVSGLKIGGVDYTVRAVVAEQPNGNRFYDHNLTQIEKGELIDSLSGITTPGFNQPTLLPEYKDKKLISILQMNEEKTGEKINDIKLSIRDLSDKLHTPIRVVNELNEIVDEDSATQQRKGDPKGWFDPATGVNKVTSAAIGGKRITENYVPNSTKDIWLKAQNPFVWVKDGKSDRDKEKERRAENENIFESAERIVEKERLNRDYDKALSVVNEFSEKCAGACKTLVIKSRNTLRSQMEAIHIGPEDIDKYEKWFDENKTIAFYVPKYERVIVLDTNYSKEDLNAYLWHENVHVALNNLENRDDVISRIVPLINTHVNYIIDQVDNGYSDKSDGEKREEYVTHFFEELLMNEKESLMLNGDVRLRDVEANNAVKEILNYINNGREKKYDRSRSNISRRRTGSNGGSKISFNEKVRNPKGNVGYEKEGGRVWNDLRSVLEAGEERLRRKDEGRAEKERGESRDEIAPSIESLSNDVSGKDFDSFLGDVNSRFIEGGSTQNERWDDIYAINFRESNGKESRYDNALRVQNDFMSRYNSGDILVIKNADTAQMQAESIGINDEQLLNDIKVIASDGETSAVYSPYYDKILIFAENGNGDYESSLFHENVHRSINKVFGFDSHSISSLYDGLYKRLKKEFDIIREGYSLESEYNQKEECVAYYLEHLFEKRNLNKMSRLIDSSNMNIVDQILNYIGYERKEEQGGGRGRSVLGISEREVGQLRNDEAPEINEKDSGGERSDAGGIRRENSAGAEKERGESRDEIAPSIESLSNDVSGKDFDSFLGDVNSRFIEGGSTQNERWDDIYAINFRESNGKESRYDNALRVQNDFMSRYNSGDILVIKNADTAQMQAESIGINDEQLLNDIKVIASDGETSAVYSPYYDKILIFAENGSRDYESTMFHENFHRAIRKLEISEEDINGLFVLAYPTKKAKFDKALDVYKQLGESELTAKEECVVYSLESGIYQGFDKFFGPIQSNKVINEILDFIGYENGNEGGRRLLRQELGADAELRNNEAPYGDEKKGGSGRIDSGRIREEDVSGSEKKKGESGDEIVTSVESLSKELNTPVRIVRDVNDLTDSDRDMLKRKRRSKGWYDPKTGDVVFMLPNAESIEDAVATILHEVVAHKGLHEMFGKDFDGFLDNVYGGVSEEIRTHINRMAQKHGFDIRIATEEYLAELAERGFEGVHEKSAWETIKAFFSDMLSHVGVKLSKSLNDEDLRYILWKSQSRLKSGDSIIEKAEKITKDREVSDRLFRFREESTSSRVDDQSSEERDGIARQDYEYSLDKAKNKMYRWQEAYQDSMLGLKKMQEAIEKESGETLRYFEDAYMAENQMSSRSGYETDVYKDKFFIPMMDAVRALVKDGAKQKDVSRYVMAKHGLERNVVFAKRDAEQAAEDKFRDEFSELNKLWDEGEIELELFDERIVELNARRGVFCEGEYQRNRTRDYSGLKQLTGEEEDFEEAAMDWVDAFENAHSLLCDALWEKVNAATKRTLKKSYESGVMTKGTYDKVRGMFEYYVPLTGWDDKVASDVYEYMLSEKSVFQAPVKRASGRESLADDPFANIGNMAESGILQGNRNLMKQKFLNMVLNHPTSLATVKTMWYENVGSSEIPVWEQSFPDIKVDATAEGIAQAVENHEARMAELGKNGMARKSTKGVDLDYRASTREINEHIVVVKSGGREHMVFVNGNPRAAQAINGLTNPDTIDDGPMKMVGIINRQLAANFTTRNPAFVLSNMSRDVIFSASAIWLKEDWKYAKRFDKNIAKNIGGIVGLMARYKSGKLDMHNLRDRYFLEFLENGGETGYTALHNVDEYKRMMNRYVRKSDGALGSLSYGAHAIVDAVGFMNRCAENVSRFTTYQTSREMGRGISESVRDAKEVTVNFNKKGASGLGAGTFKSLFLFFNAAVQSLKNFKDLHGKSKSKFYTTIGGFASAGILVPMINNAMIEMLVGDGDDAMTDEESADWMKRRGVYDNLPEWIRKNNFCLWVGGERFITIPLPIELRAFYGLGEMWYQIGRGNMKNVDGKVDVKKVSIEMVNQLSELLPINPLGGNGDAWSVIVPDAVKPLYQVFTNRDFFGKPIYKSNYNEMMPAWTKAYNGTADWMVNSAEFVNELFGGDKYMKGDIDVNPAIVEHAFEGYFGGMGKTVNQLYKTISMIWNEDERMMRNVPVLNRFLTGSDNKIEFRKVNEVYYRYMDEYKETEQRLIGYENEAEMGIEEYAEKFVFLYESKENERYQVMKGYKSAIDELYKSIKESDPREKKEIEMEINLLKIGMIEDVGLIQ